MKNKPTVFILAAGLGSRLKPFTNHVPKALVELNGTPLLEHQIKMFKKQGFSNFIVNIHHFGDQILAFLDANKNFGVNIQISDERELLLNTGGGLKNALSLLENTKEVLAHNVDVLTNMDYVHFTERFRKSNADALLAVRARTTERNLLFDSNYLLRGWKNNATQEVKGLDEPGFKGLAFSGIHILDTALIRDFKQEAAFSVIDAYLSVMSDHKIQGYSHDSDIWLDLGKPEHLVLGGSLVEKLERN